MRTPDLVGMSDGEKLNLVAGWFDQLDKKCPGFYLSNKVQEDLRRVAREFLDAEIGRFPNFNRYQRAAMKTAVYPTSGKTSPIPPSACAAKWGMPLKKSIDPPGKKRICISDLIWRGVCT